MKQIFLLIAIIISLTGQAFAVQNPKKIGRDPHFQTFIYGPNEVYKYTGFYLYGAYIEFAQGETVNTISMGDSTDWQIVNLENRMFIKPVGPYPNTNMMVITNKRMYHFELYAAEAKSIDDKKLSFVTKFIYPDDEDNSIVKFNPKRSQAPDLTNPSKYNFAYEFTGAPNIAPIKVFDDGEFTFLEFSDKNAELPAVFLVDADGYESLVNFRMLDNYVVIERVATQFTLRRGSDIVCVFNTAKPGARKPIALKDLNERNH